MLLLLLPVLVNAHEVRPAIVDFKAGETDGFGLTIKFNMEAWLARIGKDHAETADSPNSADYDRLRKISGRQLAETFEADIAAFLEQIKISFDGKAFDLKLRTTDVPPVGDVDLARDSIVKFSGNIPTGIEKLTWKYELGPSVLRVEGADAKKVSLYVEVGETSEPIGVTVPEPRSALSSFLDYVTVGFDHIIPKGLDHILFVVGLFLLSTRLRPLLWQITSFTIAHTVTLGLGMAGIISIPANIVEPLIAASIIYVAVENIFMDRLSPWRPVVVFFFGLLHGLGFAGVLSEFGLDSGNFIAGLIGFNVGVELGQLCVIAGCFLVVGFWFGRKEWYHKRVTIPGSLIIGIVAIWWFYERVFLA